MASLNSEIANDGKSDAKFKAQKREDSSFFSKLSFQYLNQLLKEGLTKKLDLDSFPDIDSFNESKFLSESVMKNWNKQVLKNGKEEARLLKSLWKAFGSEYCKAGLCLLIESIVRVGQALITALFLDFFAIKYSSANLNYAILLALGLIMTQVIMVSINNVGFYLVSKLGMQVRVSLITLIYEKLLTLNVSHTSSTGLIVNLMSNDVQRFEDISQFICYLIIGPFELLISVYFIYLQIDYAAFVAVGLLFLLLPLQSLFSSIFTRLRSTLVKYQDGRVSSLSDMFSGIMIVKLYTWEVPFIKNIETSRSNEIKFLKKSALVKSINEAIFFSSATLISSLAFLCYYFISGSLTASRVFSTITLLSNIRLSMTRFFPRSIQMGAECLIALKRIQNFLNLDNKDNLGTTLEDISIEVLRDHYSIKESEISNLVCVLNNASFIWKLDSFGKSHSGKDTVEILHDISITISTGMLYGVCGPVGGGKSSFSSAILGEMDCQYGFFARKKMVADRKLKIAYSSQTSWIFSGSIKDNITFGSVWDETWFNEVIIACAMDKDIDNLPDGVNTIVGERGVTLSGGQKARLSLARSVYSDADLYILDDPLSAVDTKVGRHIFESCIKSLLLKTKNTGQYRRSPAAVILITHQLQYIPSCDHILILNQGRIESQGTFRQIVNFEHNNTTSSSFAKKMKNFLDGSKQQEDLTEPDRKIDIIEGTDAILNSQFLEDIEISKTEFMKEDSAIGNVSYTTYFTFLTGGVSHPILAALLLLYLLLGQAAGILSTYWLSVWSNQTIAQQNSSVVLNSAVLIGLVVSVLFISFTGAASFFIVCLNSTTLMFTKMLTSVVRSPLNFFHKNPHGRLMNRFSKDLNIADEILPPTFFDAIQLFLILFGIFTITAIIIPVILISFPFLLVVLYKMRKYYIHTSRQLRRYEAITRSPIYSEIPVTLEGLSTIRAFSSQNKALFNFYKLVNKNTSLFFAFICTTRWLAVRMDAMAALFLVLVTFSSLLLKIYSDLSPGACGLILTYSITLVGLMQFAVRQSTEVENYMISAERVMEYTSLPSEADNVTDISPPPGWPSKGEVKVTNFSLKYEGADKRVLDDINIEISAGSKVGIVGRTGAGKSSFLQGLFRLIEPDSGRILIDGIDTSILGLKDLRSRISIIPQEPFCFKGTLRFNLDPFQNYTDDQLWKALEAVELKRSVELLPAKLETPVSEGGSNFSVGERQLICLARAVLRNTKLIVMDEATSSVDLHTDALIQKVLRSDNFIFKNATVLTIAHRLNTVIDYDKIMVLDNGKLVEFGSPRELLGKDSTDPDAWFKRMVEEMGQEAASNLTKVVFSNDT